MSLQGLLNLLARAKERAKVGPATARINVFKTESDIKADQA